MFSLPLVEFFPETHFFIKLTAKKLGLHKKKKSDPPTHLIDPQNVTFILQDMSSNISKQLPFPKLYPFLNLIPNPKT